MNGEAYKKRNLENKVLRQFQKLDEALKGNFNVCKNVGEWNCYVKFLVKFSVLIVVKILKLFFAGTVFSVTMMFPELVMSTSDYAFTLYVDLLTIRIRNYSKSINHTNFKVLEVRQDFLAFHKLSLMLMKRFRISLFLNITLNFVLLIINMYWIFIRIVYGPFR
jgi:hypothetical protein